MVLSLVVILELAELSVLVVVMDFVVVTQKAHL